MTTRSKTRVLPQVPAFVTEVSPPEAVDRAVAELRRGSVVVILADESAALVRAAETVDTTPLAYFGRPGVGEKTIVVTGRRAAILGLGQPGARAVILHTQQELSPDRIASVVDPQSREQRVPPPGVTAAAAAAHSPADTAILLTKIARLLPAAVLAPLSVDNPAAWAKDAGRVAVTVAAIEAYDRTQADDLRPVSEARVPLLGVDDTRIVAFRPRDGSAEHLAIIIGKPDPAAPVLTRLHSECFTGDLLGSLRCDCGDQLRGAIATIAKAGGGVLLYLAQEGRGIGLVNKLRAYTLQDQGFDTLDANEQLGFDDDERVYLPAVRMLRHFGFNRVRLLTNNPAKVGALARHGIDVAERVPHVFPSNEHNRSYLHTKATRSGHLF